MQELHAKYAASLEDRLQLQLQLRFQQAKALALSADVRVLQTEVAALRRICETSQISPSTRRNQKLILVQQQQQEDFNDSTTVLNRLIFNADKKLDTFDNHSLLTSYTPILHQLFPGQNFTPQDLLSIDDSVREFLFTKLSNDDAQVNLCRVPHTKHGETIVPDSAASSTTCSMLHAIPVGFVGDFKDWIDAKIVDILDGEDGGDCATNITAMTAHTRKNGQLNEDVFAANGSGIHTDIGIATSSPTPVLNIVNIASPNFGQLTLKRKRGRNSTSGTRRLGNTGTSGGLPTPPSEKSSASPPAETFYIIDTMKPSTLHFPTACPPLLPSGASNTHSFRAWTDVIRSRHKTFQRATPPMSKHARVFLQSRNIPLHCIVPGSAVRIAKATFAVPGYLHNEFLEYMDAAFLRVEDGVFGDSTLHSARPRIILGGGDGWDPKFSAAATAAIVDDTAVETEFNVVTGSVNQCVSKLVSDGDDFSDFVTSGDGVDSVSRILPELVVDNGPAVSHNVLAPTMNTTLCKLEASEDDSVTMNLPPHELKRLKTSLVHGGNRNDSVHFGVTAVHESVQDIAIGACNLEDSVLITLGYSSETEIKSA